MFEDTFEISVESNLETLRDIWSPLADAAGNPFVTWEWASVWWRHFGAGRKQHIVVLRDEGGDPVGIVPLYYDSKGPCRVLRFVGHFPSDELGPVCAPDRTLEVAYALRRHLDSRSDWDLFLEERAPEVAGLCKPLRARQLRTEPMPELRITTDVWDQFLETKSSNFRGQARNYERRLLRSSQLTYKLCDRGDLVDPMMQTLFDLHRRGWQAKGMSGAFPESLTAFHTDFAREALRRGWLRLWIAELDEEPAAAWLGFRLAGTDFYYQGGRDPERERQSIGFVLMVHTLRDAIESGVTTYKLLLGSEEYKKRFSDREPRVETFAAHRSMRGRLALDALSADNWWKMRRARRQA